MGLNWHEHGAQWTRRDALVWSSLTRWSRWQRLLWWLIAWTPFEVRVIMSRDGRRPYLLRATLWPRLARWLPPVFLHYGFRPDEEDELHNHPWNAVSLILSEGYREERYHPGRFERTRRTRRPGTFVFLRRDTYHRILSGGWFSLFVPFKRVDLPEEVAWSFWDPEGNRRWSWRKYVDEKRGQK